MTRPTPLPLLLLLTLTVALAEPAPTLFDTPWDDRSIFEANLVPGEQAVLENLGGASIYHLELTLADDLRSVLGRQQVRVSNSGSAPLPDIVLRLYPNLLEGRMRVSRVRVNGTPTLPRYEAQRSVLRVTLPQPLAPGERVVIGLEFHLSVPEDASRNYGVLGLSGGTLKLAHSYPTVAVHGDIGGDMYSGAHGDGWDTRLPSPAGDILYADSSFYLVRVHAPRGQVVVASGTELSRDDHAHAQTLTFAAGPARDFYLVSGRDLEAIETTTGGVTVRSYAPAGLQQEAEIGLAYAVDALEFFGKQFGPYPYTTLDLVAAETLAGGIEYPGVVVVSNRYYATDFFETIVVHEVAHQWFYNVVGSDQLGEPWLDEALTQYNTLRYYREVRGPNAAQRFRQSLQQSAQSASSPDLPIGQPVAAYSPRDYAAIVYGRGPLFFEALEQTLGQTTFDTFLRSYYQTHRWQIVTGEALQTLAEEACGCDLEPLFAQWVYGGPLD